LECIHSKLSKKDTIYEGYIYCTVQKVRIYFQVSAHLRTRIWARNTSNPVSVRRHHRINMVKRAMLFWLSLDLASPSIFLCISPLCEAGRSLADITWQGGREGANSNDWKKLGLPYLNLFRESGQEIKHFLEQLCVLNRQFLHYLYPIVDGTILNKTHLFFTLECLAQLHGTGMAYALSHANSSQEKTLQSLTGEHRWTATSEFSTP
jgi:hypothetical protein